MTLDQILDKVIAVEGGYSNNPSDSGGETIWGVTVSVARGLGYKGDMKDMTREQAKWLYLQAYVRAPGFDKVHAVNAGVGFEVIDTGVNCGTSTSGMILQRALNVLGQPMKIDGHIGPVTINALVQFLNTRANEGEVVLLRMLNALQGVRYVELVEGSQKNSKFIFGWFLNRVVI